MSLSRSFAEALLSETILEVLRGLYTANGLIHHLDTEELGLELELLFHRGRLAYQVVQAGEEGKT